MLPIFLIPEKVLYESGAGDIFELGASSLPLMLTLGILETVEQQSLLLGLYGSADGIEWPATPLLEFPQKFYEGLSSLLLDPAEHEPGAYRFIRAQWKTNRWGRGSKTPMFKLYLFAEAVQAPAEEL